MHVIYVIINECLRVRIKYITGAIFTAVYVYIGIENKDVFIWGS